MSTGTEQGLGDAIRFDLKRMHETWMELVYPRQRGADHTVLGTWKPTGGLSLRLYQIWSAIGAPVVALVYPLVLLGYFLRFQTRRVNVTAVKLGLPGIVVLFALVWGALAALVRFPFSSAFSSGGVTAIVAASGVAIAAAALSYVFWRLDGRFLTVFLAYPFAMTAIFLPPIVAALFSTAVAQVVLTRSDSIARWFVFEGPDLFGAKDYLVENFERDEFAHVIIWFAVSFPIGWILGILVTLADLVRPTEE
jgi:hypothetical protein